MRLKQNHVQYISRKIAKDLVNCDFVEIRSTKEAVAEQITIIMNADIKKESVLDEAVEDLLDEQEDDIEGVQKDVRELIYTSNELETPANFDSSNRKINVIMREHIPDGADECFAFLVKNAGPSGVEIRLTQHEGHWYALSKQRDVSDLGDPFQSVGDAYQPKHVKLREDDDKEGIDKLHETRGQEIEKLIPAVLGAAAGVAAQGVGEVAQTAMDVGGEAARDDFQNQYNPEIGYNQLFAV